MGNWPDSPSAARVWFRDYSRSSRLVQQTYRPWPYQPRCQAHPDRGCQAQAPHPRYQAYRPRCHTYPVVPDAPSRVPGLPSLVLGLPYQVVPDAPSQIPGLPSPVPGSRSMSLPADVPSLAMDDRTASTVSTKAEIEDARARGQDAGENILRVTLANHRAVGRA